MDSIAEDVDLISRIPAVPAILDVVCRSTGMGFAAVARVTEDRWVACSVRDRIAFGLEVGGELEVATTICHEIRQSQQPVIIDDVACDVLYREHHTPRKYGFQSYISVPIVLPGGKFFGTLCSIDPRPARFSKSDVLAMFNLFAELIAFHIDATEKLARSESRLLAEREISELREQFIGVLGHDLRNPLGAISMGATLLQESALNADQAVTVDMMKRSVSRMSDLIDDALDFTRGRLGGGITVESRSDQPVEPVLRQVIDEVRARWPERRLTAHLDLRESIRYDRKRLAQLFTNLLTNAMTHGLAESPVTVSARSTGGTFQLAVANAAEPIPPAILQRLFEPFSRGGSADYQQGLGLGLYISSEIAKSHGGTLGVVSTEEETRFTFTMATCGPLASASPAPALPGAREAALASASARILLIDDHVDTLSALTRLLTRKGHVVTPVPTAAEARVEAARRTFDLIVSDLVLPDCSGLDLIPELRSARPIPAIAMSGYGTESDIRSSEAAGFTAHLTKPIDFQQLLQAVDRLAQDGG